MADDVIDGEYEVREQTALVQQHQETALESITRGEIATAVDIAKKYQRSVGEFKRELSDLTCASQATARSCHYTLPARKGSEDKKPITGPSIRFAELAMVAYGNMRVLTRVVEIAERQVTVQGIAFDMQKNITSVSDVTRQIWGKYGRYNDNLINVTIAAAQSIARRNAILQVIPRVYFELLEDKIRRTAAGEVKDLAAARADCFTFWKKTHNVGKEEILQILDARSEDEIGAVELETLRGFIRAMQAKELTIEDLFPESAKPNLVEKVREQAAKNKATEETAKPKGEPAAEPPVEDGGGPLPEVPERKRKKKEEPAESKDEGHIPD